MNQIKQLYQDESLCSCFACPTGFSRNFLLLTFRLLAYLVPGGFAALGAACIFTYSYSRGLVPHTTSIPKIPLVSTRTLRETLFGSRPDCGKRLCREDEIEKSVFRWHHI
jgi:hypothetical protein